MSNSAIILNRDGFDLKIEADRKLDFRDVLIRPRPSRLSSRREVNITRIFEFPHTAMGWTGFPLIASNMDATGTIRMARALARHNALTALSKYYEVQELAQFFTTQESENSFYTMGITTDDWDKLEALKSRISVEKICIEVANGYIKDLQEFVDRVRKANANSIIMAGSVCTPEMTQNLLRAGADIIRVGIGSGSVCITRKLTGVGYPQLSAILECSEAAHQVNGFICSDGGCTTAGDVCKAYGAGADFVMLGGMLTGHTECEGKIRYKTSGGRKRPVSMQFYGMASALAQKKHYGGVSSYGVPEGIVVEVPYRGNVATTLQDIMGGLRSMMTYIDAKELAEVPAKTSFVRVGAQLNTVYGE